MAKEYEKRGGDYEVGVSTTLLSLAPWRVAPPCCCVAQSRLWQRRLSPSPPYPYPLIDRK